MRRLAILSLAALLAAAFPHSASAKTVFPQTPELTLCMPGDEYAKTRDTLESKIRDSYVEAYKSGKVDITGLESKMLGYMVRYQGLTEAVKKIYDERRANHLRGKDTVENAAFVAGILATVEMKEAIKQKCAQHNAEWNSSKQPV